jgi:restriction endonuclease S subunit
MTPLGDVASVSTAYPFRKKVESELGGDVPLIQIRDIDNVERALGTGTVVLRNDGGKYDRYILREGDLLFQSRGSRYPVAVVGVSVRGIAASGLHVIRPTRVRVIPEYLAWWLNHPVSQGKLAKDIARGTYIPFVSKRDLEAFLVPTPEIAVQSQIVAVDRLRRRERNLCRQLDVLIQQLMDSVTMAAATRNN